MTVPAEDRELARCAEALCVLLGAGRELRDLPEVRGAAARAKLLLESGEADADEVRAAFQALDDALRRAGDARGLFGQSRSAASEPTPGVGTHIKVAVCPAPVACSRLERARDLLPAPPCAVSGQRMRKVRLRPGP